MGCGFLKRYAAAYIQWHITHNFLRFPSVFLLILILFYTDDDVDKMLIIATQMILHKDPAQSLKH